MNKLKKVTIEDSMKIFPFFIKMELIEQEAITDVMNILETKP